MADELPVGAVCLYRGGGCEGPPVEALDVAGERIPVCEEHVHRVRAMLTLQVGDYEAAGREVRASVRARYGLGPNALPGSIPTA